MKTLVSLDVKDSQGNLKISYQKESRSWVKNFINLLYTMSADNTTLSLSGVLDISNTARTITATNDGVINPNMELGVCPGGVTDRGSGGDLQAANKTGEYRGIVVGTGTNAVAITDYALQTKIAHGQSAGTLWHGGSEVFPPTFANPNGSMLLRRLFTNYSGGSITVNECGLYTFSQNNRTQYWMCVGRDIVAPAVTVGNGEILSVVYTIQITV